MLYIPEYLQYTIIFRHIGFLVYSTFKTLTYKGSIWIELILSLCK